MYSAVRKFLLSFGFIWSALCTAMPLGFAQSPARDPGVRAVIDWSRIGGLPTNFCPSNALIPLPGLTTAEERLFCAGAAELPRWIKSRRTVWGPP
jgi:hypothetical protein